MRKDTVRNLVKIVQCLKNAEEGWLWGREIGRRTNLHHKTVARLIDKHLGMFVDRQSMEPFNVEMIKLKPGTDVNGIFRYLSVMEKLGNKKSKAPKVPIK
ncbi:MAG TPA: hypothetical protein VJJ76_00400 [archaeon]|nr:hypothetical protein [archaeon]